MKENQTLIDDMLALGGNLFGNLLGARHEMGAQAKQRIEAVAKRLDLVSRSEFDAAFSMLSKARAMQEEMNERLTAIESKLHLSGSERRVKTMKAILPSVKKSNRKRAR